MTGKKCTYLNKNKVTFFPSFPNLLPKGIQISGKKKISYMNNGVVPHNHIYSTGIYSRKQPAKFSSTGTCDSTQLRCYKMTESVLRLLKGN